MFTLNLQNIRVNVLETMSAKHRLQTAQSA